MYSMKFIWLTEFTIFSQSFLLVPVFNHSISEKFVCFKTIYHNDIRYLRNLLSSLIIVSILYRVSQENLSNVSKFVTKNTLFESYFYFCLNLNKWTLQNKERRKMKMTCCTGDKLELFSNLISIWIKISLL